MSAVSASDNATDDMSTADDSVLESEESEIIQSSDVDSNMKVDFVKQEENGTIHTIDENKDIYVNDHDSDYFRVKTPKQVTGTLSLYIDDKLYEEQGHRRAMLNSTFNCVGIGAYKLNGIIYWVQSFGKNMNL